MKETLKNKASFRRANRQARNGTSQHRALQTFHRAMRVLPV